MIKLSVNTVLFAGFDLETAMEHIAWAGYDGAELSAIQGMCEHLNLDEHDSQIADIKDLAERFELELLAMEVASLDEERLTKAFDAASKLGIPIVNVGPGGTSGDEREFDRQMEGLQALAERAEPYGVTLCVKAHVGQCVHDTPTTLAAMERISSEAFGVNMDPSHIYRAGGGEDPAEALRAVLSRLRHVHIRDCREDLRATEGRPGAPEEQTCGRGGIDLKAYVKVLHESGPDVAASLEIIGARHYELSRVTAIAAESRGFLNACLKACDAR